MEPESEGDLLVEEEDGEGGEENNEDMSDDDDDDEESDESDEEDESEDEEDDMENGIGIDQLKNCSFINKDEDQDEESMYQI